MKNRSYNLRGTRLLTLMLVLLTIETVKTFAVEYTYDSQGRLTQAILDNGSTITYTYDLAGNRTVLQQSDGVSSVPSDPMAADLDGDGLINFDDLAILRATYGIDAESSCYLEHADLYRDGRIDLWDVLVWYDLFIHGEWMSADLTGSGWSAGGDFVTVAPDDIVDFWDLAALTWSWRRTRAELPVNAHPMIGFETAIGAGHLATLRLQWHNGSGPIAAADVCPRGHVDSPTPETIGRIALKNMTRGSDDGSVRWQIGLDGQAEDIRCWQVLLQARDLTGVAGALVTADARLELSCTGDFEESAFVDITPTADGWLVTGALFEGESIRDGSTIVLGTVSFAAFGDRSTVAATDVLYSTALGAVHMAESWTGMLSLGDLPTLATLEGNQPNPFNPKTVVRFGVPSEAHVTLRVYDLRGRHVCDLVNESMRPGWYTREWLGTDQNGRQLASGIYLLHLRVGGEAVTKKATIVR